MNYEAFNQYCEKLPATTYVMQWGGSHVWKVGGKVFAIGGWDKEKGEAYSFKTPGYRPAPYLASCGFKWIQLYTVTEQNKNHLKNHLEDSHRLVSLGLSKKKQKELGLN